MIGFQRHTQETLPEKAKEWLFKASIRTGISNIDVNQIINLSNTGRVLLFSVDDDGLIGTFCLTIRDISDKRILTMLLLGGENLMSWRDDLVEFMEAIAQKYACHEFYMMGPKAYERMFPEISLVSCVYKKIPAYLTQNNKNIQ